MCEHARRDSLYTSNGYPDAAKTPPAPKCHGLPSSPLKNIIYNAARNALKHAAGSIVQAVATSAYSAVKNLFAPAAVKSSAAAATTAVATYIK